MMRLSYPTTHKQAYLPSSKPCVPKSVIYVKSLRVDDVVAKKYSKLLDSGLSTDHIPTDILTHCQITLGCYR